MGAAVAIGHLNALVAKVPLPFCVPADFILTKDVRYKVSYIKADREGKGGGSVCQLKAI